MLWLAAFLFLAGCSVGHVEQGQVRSISVGPTARAEHSYERKLTFTTPDGTRLEYTEREKMVNKGSPLSGGAADFLASVATAVGLWFGVGP